MSQKQRVAAGLNMARKAGADIPEKEGTLFVQGLVGFDAQGRPLKTFNSMKEAFEFATDKNFKEVVDISKRQRYVEAMLKPTLRRNGSTAITVNIPASLVKEDQEKGKLIKTAKDEWRVGDSVVVSSYTEREFLGAMHRPQYKNVKMYRVIVRGENAMNILENDPNKRWKKSEYKGIISASRDVYTMNAVKKILKFRGIII